jgi:hypothetical protein
MTVARARGAGATVAVEDVEAAVRRWLYLPDPQPLCAMLGAVAANRLSGDPVWLLLVGPPGSGKSELLGSLAGLPDVHPAATLTEAALLSGTARKERAEGARGGLLRTIGRYGIIVCKDFGSVLSMPRDPRAQLQAALREVYDGSWTRHVGTDGGQTLSWQGKVGLLAGVTETVDRHHAVMAALGERFLLVRLNEADNAEQARRALAHAGREEEMRRDLGGAVASLFNSGLADPRSLTDAEQDRLVSLALVVVRARSAVERDGYSRDVELIPSAEAPGRVVVQLDRLLAGLDAIGVERRQAWGVVERAALDSIPALRRAVIETLEAGENVKTGDVADIVRYPVQTTRRTLEDLAAHRVTRRDTGGSGKSDAWALTDSFAALYRAARTVPEVSGSVSSRSVPETSVSAYGDALISPSTQHDVSGTVAGRGATR